MDVAEQGSLTLDRPPSRLTGLWFGIKRIILQARRLAQDAVNGPKRHPIGTSLFTCTVERRTRLYTETDPAELRLQLGKIQNLRLAAHALNGVEVPAGTTFSFWRHVGRCTRARGYVPGRQIQEGCLMPAVGGGICQLTNALYALAIEAGLEIVERHPHTRAVPGASGPDATVAWNYIDLRFRSRESFRIEAFLTGDELVVRLLTPKPPSRMPLRLAEARKGANSCATCGQDQCHHWHEVERGETEKTAYLVDQWAPEFVEAIGPADLLFRPLDGKRWKRQRYAWPIESFDKIQNFTWLALRRGVRQRRLAEQGAARQRALLAASQELAAVYAKRLPFDVRHVVVSQSLLPFLWQTGALGGRTFDVLMSRLPMAEIHKRLDEAAERHPERKLLSDFRAPEDLLRAEEEAIAASQRQYTAHAEIASLMPNPVPIPWPAFGSLKWSAGAAIAFPGPTVARKGAYEVREAALALDLEVVLLGSELEGEAFWHGVKTRQAAKGAPLEGVFAVVQPALLEDRPIYLLKALEGGCPVVATPACGIGSGDGLHSIDPGNGRELTDVLRRLRAGQLTL